MALAGQTRRDSSYLVATRQRGVQTLASIEIEKARVQCNENSFVQEFTNSPRASAHGARSLDDKRGMK